MSSQLYDALIIGGGPGGSTAATFLARAGKSVLMLEKEHFPRFHIGESLLPYNMAIFREMGVLPELEKIGFPRKLGAQFQLGNGSKGVRLVFRDSIFSKEPEAIQVERAVFDHVLLKHARNNGADVREGWTVTKFSSNRDTVSIEAQSDDGQSGTFEGKFLIDASGRGNFTGNQEGLRVDYPHLKKLAVFGHFENVGVDDGEKSTDIVIFRLKNKWFWLIPIGKTKTSVGCVMDKAEFMAAAKEPAAIFNEVVQSSSAVRDRMKNARLVGQMRTTTDFSYRNKRLVGHRLLRVGDAAGFMDPIFSAGVYLAMSSGKLAGETVLGSLAANDDGSSRMAAYERKVGRAMQNYWDMVEGYYTTPFMEVLLEPRDNHGIASAVVAVLAGETDGGWPLYWRRKFFFWLVKLQRWRPFMPKISFD